jgi:uncharacterized Tic20 family protein
MTAQPATEPTSDERLMAALAHFFGLVVALIIWLTQKDKSRFVRFQAMQAVAFDVAVVVIIFVMVGCLAAFIIGGAALGTAGAAAAASAGDDGSLAGLFLSLTFAIPFIGNCVIILLALGLVVARIIAAVNVFQGKNYHHPWLGAQVEKMLG